MPPSTSIPPHFTADYRHPATRVACIINITSSGIRCETLENTTMNSEKTTGRADHSKADGPATNPGRANLADERAATEKLMPSPLYFRALALVHNASTSFGLMLERALGINKVDAENMVSLMAMRGDVKSIAPRHAMIPVSVRMPPFKSNERVLVYTAGVDFAGQQYFDINVSALWETDPDIRSRVAQAATHWMPRPRPGFNNDFDQVCGQLHLAADQLSEAAAMVDSQFPETARAMRAAASRAVAALSGDDAGALHPTSLAREVNSKHGELYRYLRSKMCFREGRDGDAPVLRMEGSIPAPAHDFTSGGFGEAFNASIDITVDAARRAEEN
jgi:hypothetical protein